MEAKEINVKKILLDDFLKFKYIPVLSEPGRKAWVRWFIFYWMGKINQHELASMCMLSIERFEDIFSVFIVN